MAMEHDGMSQTMVDIFDILNYVLTALFSLEVTIKVRSLQI